MLQIRYCTQAYANLFFLGVYHCSKDNEYLGYHAAKVIGWGIEKGVPYWLAVNSWSTSWGMNGIDLLSRRTTYIIVVLSIVRLEGRCMKLCSADAVQCRLCSADLQCRQYSADRTVQMQTAESALYSADLTVQIQTVQFRLYSADCTVQTVQCT